MLLDEHSTIFVIQEHIWIAVMYIMLDSIWHTVNLQLESRGLINFMAQNHPGSNQEMVEIEAPL